MRDRLMYFIPGIIILTCLLYPSTSECQEYEFVVSWSGDKLGLGVLWDMAVDGSGNMYVVDRSNFCVQKLDPDGKFLAKLGTEGSGDGQFTSPRGVTVDDSGNVYVVDTRGCLIQKLDSEGRFLIKWGAKGTDDEAVQSAI